MRSFPTLIFGFVIISLLCPGGRSQEGDSNEVDPPNRVGSAIIPWTTISQGWRPIGLVSFLRWIARIIREVVQLFAGAFQSNIERLLQRRSGGLLTRIVEGIRAGMQLPPIGFQDPLGLFAQPAVGGLQ